MEEKASRFPAPLDPYQAPSQPYGIEVRQQVSCALVATLGRASDFGQKYEVRGTIQGPSGRRAEVVTVWIILAGERSPRFVTAFPGEKR